MIKRKRLEVTVFLGEDQPPLILIKERFNEVRIFENNYFIGSVQ